VIDVKIYKEATIFPQFTNPELLSLAMNTMILVCSDVVIIDSATKSFYLANRTRRPAVGLYIIGGKRHAGETPKEGMRRKFKDETGLDVPEERFEFVTLQEFIWEDRAQPPYTPCHVLSFTYKIELSDEELAQINLQEGEYNSKLGLKKFNREELYAAKPREQILDLYELIFPKKVS